MFSSISIGSATSHVTVVGVTSDGRTVPSAPAKVDAVADALRIPGFAGDTGEVLPAGRSHVLLGLGAPDAGVEAAWAAASALGDGGRVALITMDPTRIGAMS
ncbi:MAG: hypothetical protein ACKOHI_10900, partial [Phycisphaerales bacterium]